jgi:hypothetical protein
LPDEKRIHVNALASGFDQILKLRMFRDISGNKGALRDDLQFSRAGDIERAFRKLRADAAPGERLRQVGMRDGDHARREILIGKSRVTIRVEFEATLHHIVAYLGHDFDL